MCKHYSKCSCCRNVFYLVESVPKFVEEYNFVMQTLFHCPKMPSTQFYEGLVRFGIEDKVQYFRMSDKERATIWDGWTEEGPKKPRRRAEIDFFNLVTDPSVTNGAVLKMPHPENRVVLRGANLIIDSRNTEHHFYARVFSRGSGKNNVVNNIVFNKLTKRVEMDSDVRKTHLPDRGPNENTEFCDDELPPLSVEDEDPLAAFRCPGSKRPQSLICNY
ncbi:unnamed protein product [Notodromas monacha]|uniref:Uncharacterized protein n=1 Tax=Notodromas monacha TaxID=399045 RepID=A0A7R9GI98_9CRUS|nr:unnamed protein product [Notodromas monacha]CAG0923637.1 unnamed protein product [Notodromas monacha]